MSWDWHAVFSGAVGAVLGATASFLVQVFKISVDETWARAEELCKSIADVADFAADYWLSEVKPSRVPTEAASELEGRRLSLTEHKIIGLQTKIDGLHEQLTRKFTEEDSSQTVDSLASFIDACSGGSFATKGRAADGDRARLAQTSGANAIVTIRSAVRNSTSLPRLVERYSSPSIFIYIFVIAAIFAIYMPQSRCG